jgi:GxxExxY protein
MKNEKYIHSDITHKIIGCAMNVHSNLGSGFMEVVYQRSLAIELEKQKIFFDRELEIPIHYNGIEVGMRRVDFKVDNKIMVELKAISQLEDIHIAQVINYLEASDFEIGLLLNFGSKSLEFRRFINQKKFKNLKTC